MRVVLTRQWQALLLALRFLTTLPVPGAPPSAPEIQGRALLWYPFVGLVLGGLLAAAQTLLPGPGYLQAALLVCLWVGLTGALHLDGLADTADAWLGGMGDRDATLRILRDPLCGSAGVVALVLILGLKTAGVAALIEGGIAHWVWCAPTLARVSLLVLFASTPYVRPGGLGAEMARHFPRSWGLGLTLAAMLLFLVLLPWALWLTLGLILFAVTAAVRGAAAARLGGFTGDIAGAQVEIAETALLLGLVVWAGEAGLA